MAIQHRGTEDTARGGSEGVGYIYGASNIIGPDLAHAEPLIRPHQLRYWFPRQFQIDECITSDRVDFGGAITTTRRFPNYKIYKTQYTGVNNEGNTSVRDGMITFLNQVIDILRMRATWRVIVFGFATSAIAMNWTASELILPPFLERRFGEVTPIYIIQSINLFGCLILPPLVGAYTSGREDFTVFMPGTPTKGIYVSSLTLNLFSISQHSTNAPYRQKDFGSWPSRQCS